LTQSAHNPGQYVQADVFPTPQTSFNSYAKDPERKHIKADVIEAGVEKHRRDKSENIEIVVGNAEITCNALTDNQIVRSEYIDNDVYDNQPNRDVWWRFWGILNAIREYK